MYSSERMKRTQPTLCIMFAFKGLSGVKALQAKYGTEYKVGSSTRVLCKYPSLHVMVANVCHVT